MPSKKRKYNARFPTGRIKKIMRIDVDIGKVALPVPVMISRALELFVSSLLNKAGNITLQKNARTLTLTHLKQCIYSDSRLDFLKELVKNTPELSEESNDNNSAEPPVTKKMITTYDSDDEPTLVDDRSSYTMIETVKSRLLTSGCLCGLPEHVIREAFSIKRRTELAFFYLMDVRLLLCTLRRQFTENCWCQVVCEASMALLHDPKWFDSLLKLLTNAKPNKFVMHAALCTMTEVALCFGERQLANLISELILEVVEPRVGLLPSQPAIAVLGRMLDEINNDSAKTLLLEKLNKRWMGIWKSVADCTDNRIERTRLEVILFWKSVMVSQTAKTIGPRFYSELSSLENLIYRVDTDPHVWMGTIRLFGASLHIRSSVGPKKFTCQIATNIILNVYRLLFFMGKIRNRYVDEHDRITVVQETVMLVLRSVRVIVKICNTSAAPLENNGFDPVRLMTDVINRLDSYIKSSEIYEVHVSFIRWAVRMMYDLDDAVIELLRCTLDVASAMPELRLLFDPFVAFTEFLACSSFDHSVLLDYLISDENDFLIYVMCILKAACSDVHWFFRGSGDRLTDIVDLLTRLRLKLLRLYRNNVFPYNIRPLTKLIQRLVILVTLSTVPTAQLILNNDE